MPQYEFICEQCGCKGEATFAINDEKQLDCILCNTPMKRVFAPVGAIFKGDGWGGKA